MIKTVKLKSFIIFAVILLLSFGAFTVSAKDYDGFSLDVPENFKCVSDVNDVGKLSDTVGMSEDKLKEYYKSSNLVLLAIDDSNSTQIKISEIKNVFSREAVSFKRLNNDELISISGSFFDTAAENGGEVTVVESNGLKFLKFVEMHKDSGGVYTATNYITVENKKIYRISFLAPDEENTDVLDDVFKSFTIKEKGGHGFSLGTVFILLAILFFLLVIVLSVVNIIKPKSEAF